MNEQKIYCTVFCTHTKKNLYEKKFRGSLLVWLINISWYEIIERILVKCNNNNEESDGS